MIDKNEIIIEEIEEGSPCDCLCLYDYTLEIKNLPAAIYSVTVIELYSVASDSPNLDTQPDKKYIMLLTASTLYRLYINKQFVFY